MAHTISYSFTNTPKKCNDCRENGETVRATHLCGMTDEGVFDLLQNGTYLCDDCVACYDFPLMYRIIPDDPNTGEWASMVGVYENMP